ncbi:hypothetical protein D3C80_2134680 [compost metagenome]
MEEDFLTKYKNVDAHEITLKPNIEVVFIIVPFESVTDIKTELEKLEVAMR